jgi:CTP synthase (UTP-ammonia lyase)
MIILNDFSTSVRKSLSEINPDYESLNGLVVCGTHNQQNITEMLDVIRKAREDGSPALLICAGYQLGAIEYAQNVLNVKDATSEEFGEGVFIVKKRPELKVGLHEGESWWSYYEVDPEFERNWSIPNNWVAVPFHPEYQSSQEKPHPLLVKFLNLCSVE